MDRECCQPACRVLTGIPTSPCSCCSLPSLCCEQGRLGWSPAWRRARRGAGWSDGTQAMPGVAEGSQDVAALGSPVDLPRGAKAGASWGRGLGSGCLRRWQCMDRAPWGAVKVWCVEAGRGAGQVMPGDPPPAPSAQEPGPCCLGSTAGCAGSATQRPACSARPQPKPWEASGSCAGGELLPFPPCPAAGRPRGPQTREGVLVPRCHPSAPPHATALTARLLSQPPSKQQPEHPGKLHRWLASSAMALDQSRS